MQKLKFHTLTLIASLILSGATVSLAHDVITGAHTHDDEDATTIPQRQNLNHHKADKKDISASKVKLTTGQGDFVFSFDESLTSALPEAALPHEKKMHGGFNEDPETNIVYTGIPGYGLCAISADLKSWSKLGDDERLLGTIHGLVFFVHNNEKRLAMAFPSAKYILIADIEGNVLQQIDQPKGTEFDFAPANTFYTNDKKSFSVTDVTYLDGTIFAVTGYSKGDFVLTLKEANGQWHWGKIAWGGKGSKAGQFNTAHGVYAHEGMIYVASRAAHQIIEFTPKGDWVRVFNDTPPAMFCNVSYKKGHFFFNALKKIDETAHSASIFAHTGHELVSTITPGELNIPVLNNIHHTWPHIVKDESGNDQFYLLVHGWNKGKYAVLKQE